MGCNCKKTTDYNICNPAPCVEPQSCDCPTLLETKCVTFEGNDLECSGIKKGTILTELIQQLDTFICEKINDITNALTLKNIGDGAKVYKGDDLLGRKELRTVKKTGNLVTVTENTNDISVSIDETALDTFIEENQLTSESNQLDESNANIYKDTTVVDDVSTFNFRSLIVSSEEGVGQSVVRDVQENVNDVTIRLKKLKSDTLTITSTEEELVIESPTTTSNLSFYVDVNSTADNETGALSSPFKTLNKALDTFIGTGTWFNPQFKNYKITLLSSCSLVETPGVDYNGYINLDINNLQIEGNGFYLGLYANPFVDYYPISTRRMVADMPKTGGVLDYDIDLRFNDIVFQRTGTNAIVDHLNYSFPTADMNVSTFPPPQNGSRMWFTNCTLTNDTNKIASGNFNIVPNPDDGGNPLLLFGEPVYASNTEPWGVPMVKTEGRAWNKEGEFRLGNSKLVNSTGTGIKAVNTSYNDYYDTSAIGMYSYFRLYESEVDGYYSPRLGTYMIELEDVNYMSINNLRINWTTPRVTTTELVPRSVIVGGVESLYKLKNSSLNIYGESSDQDQVMNLVQLDGNSNVTFDGYRSDGQISDATYGAFKVITPLPVSAKQITSLNSYLRNVIADETGVDKTFIQQISGIDNNINNSPHNTYQQYANDTVAKATGLIRGNVYYNTTIGALKTII